MIFQVRDGKIARLRTYVPTGVILQQLGVLPGGDQA
jgi:ketosteroid isomerase-like protein